MSLKIRIALAIILFATFVAVAGFAQTTLGVIAGSVTDSSGAVVVGATVTVQRAEGGEPRTMQTAANGDYRIESLTPGTYTVTVSAEHFSKTELANIVVSASVTTPVNVRLSVGSATETVTVDGSVPQVQTEGGQIDAVIPTAQIRDLPLIGGNPYSLAITLPGVSQPDQRDNFTNGFGFSVNGLRPRANNFLIDGFDNNDYAISGQALQPSNQEAISSLTVLENSYDAEYGRGGGSVSVVTYKSGTNTFHGSLWEQYGGSALNAVTAEQQASGLTKAPHQVNNVFGFTVGGPVVKDKLFFFGTSQWTRDIGAPTTAGTLNIPTAAGISTLKTVLAGATPGSGVFNNTQVLLNSLGGLVAPNPNGPLVDLNDENGCTGCSVQFGTFTRSDSERNLSYEWTVRADYIPNSTDNMFVRFTNTYNSLIPDLFANSSALPPQDTQQGGPARNLGVMWGHSFAPTVQNEFRFSAQTIGFTFGPTAATLANPLAHVPGISFTGASFSGVALGGFEQGAFPQGRAHNTYQFQDALSVVKGSHSMKMGTDLAIILVKDGIPFNADGLAVISPGGKTCTFNGVTGGTCSDLANYIDDFSGPTGSISRQFGNPKISVPTSQQSFYFQDSWKIRPNFTLDYGLRYEYQPLDAENVLPYPAVDRKTVLTNPLQTAIDVKPYRNSWGPRLGFSYSPKFWQSLFGENKTVIRAGAGVFYDSFFTNISDNAAAGSPNTLGGTTQGQMFANAPVNPQPRGVPTFMESIAAVAPVADPTNTVESVVDNLRNPRTYQWNVNIQRELPAKFIGQIAYVGTRGTALWDNEQLNPRVLSTPSFGDPDNRINPNKGSIVARGNRGDSIYHGLQLEVNRNVGRLSLRGAYTWSRSIDNGSEVFITTGGSSFWQNVADPRSDRGPSAFNHTHVASFTWVYALPDVKKGFLNQAFGGWETTGSVIFQSGAPETLYFGGFDVNGDGQGNDRPSVINPKAPLNLSTTCIQSPQCVTGLGFSDPADFGPGIFDLGQLWFEQSLVLLPLTGNQVRYLANFGQNGSLGRNSINLPGMQTWDLAVLKNFKVPYRESQVQFRADFFNAFNHFNAGQNNISGYGNLLNPGAGFYGPKSLTLDGGRSIVLWLKYSF
jgi:carboxypeptidase family protein/TonB-dependent receptor-like protein